MTRKPNRSVAEAGVPVLAVVVVVPAPLVDVDVAVEEDVAVGVKLVFGRGGGVPVDDMAAWEQRVPLLQVRGGTGQTGIKRPLRLKLCSHVMSSKYEMVQASTLLRIISNSS